MTTTDRPASDVQGAMERASLDRESALTTVGHQSQGIVFAAYIAAFDDRAILAAEVERLRVALDWYANTNNYLLIEDTGHEIPGEWDGIQWSDTELECRWVNDAGRRARVALGIDSDDTTRED